MKFLDLQKHETNQLVGQPVKEADAQGWVDIEPGTIVRVDGVPEVIYAPLDMGPSAGFHVEQAVRVLPYRDSTRLSLNQNEPGAERTMNLSSSSRIKTRDTQFGFRPQRPVFGLPAGPCKLNSDFPLQYISIEKMGGWLQTMYQAHNHEKYAQHFKTMAEVRDDCRIGGAGSIFTQGVANKANILPYHYDAGNFPGAWSAMVYFTRAMEGGNLLLPGLKARLLVQDRTYVLFDGQGSLHGVSPATGTKPGAYRYSLVYYALRLMQKVGTQDEQIAKIRHSDMVKHNKALKKGTDEPRK